MNNKLPCKNCILYAMCKPKYSISTIDTVLKLMPYCSTLYNYLTDGSQKLRYDEYQMAYVYYSPYKIRQITKVFNWSR